MQTAHALVCMERCDYALFITQVEPFLLEVFADKPICCRNKGQKGRESGKAYGGFSLDASYAIIVGMSQNEQKPREELSAVVVGRVQGVGFRYFVIGKARMLGVCGYVRNDSTGDVEVVAQGTRPALEQLLVHLRQGPPAAEVHKVQFAWREPTEYFSTFHMRW